MRRRAVLVGAVLVAASCSGGDGDVADPPPRAVLQVLASNSLTDAFQALGERFIQQYDGVRVDFTFAASSLLMGEIERGRPGAVIATVDQETMRLAVEEGHAREPVTFARNHLGLFVAAGNPKGIHGFSDLQRDDVRFGRCSTNRTCGELAEAVLEKSGVDRTPEAELATSRSVVVKLVDGELDAAVVFVTSVRADEAIDTVVALDGDSDPELEAVYEMAVLAGAVARDEAQAWVDFVLGAEGQAILAEHGFAAP